MYYEPYFGLNEPPFSISPDPRYLYLTQNHREALAHLLYGVSSNGGFVLLTGEIGAGKTTVCRCLLDQLPQHSDVAYVLNSKLSTTEFLAAICDELHIPYGEYSTLKHLTDRIHRYLLDAHSRGRNTVLMVDEAQNLDIEVIEHLRLLTNLETAEKKLLQIILIGQPELRDKLELPAMKPMAQRITARFHLNSLNRREIRAYVQHRLKVAGAKRELFGGEGYKKLWQYSGGVPRLINIICDRALLGAFVSKVKTVDGKILDHAASEVLGCTTVVPTQRRWAWLVLVLMLMMGAFAAAYHYRVELEAAVFPDSNDFGAPPAAGNEPASVTVPEPAPRPQAQAPVDNPEPDTSVIVETAASLPDPRPPEVETVALQKPAAAEASAWEQAAVATLMARWGVDYQEASPGVAPCVFAQSKGLACLWQEGNTESLRALDRSALLTLYDVDGMAFTVVLAGMDEQSALVAVGDWRQRVSLTELRRWWYGEFMVLWRPPPGYRFPLREGARGETVNWVLQQLDIPGDTPVYDAAVTGRVKWFQRNSGLIPDGVVGPQTLIALNNTNGADVPRLTNGYGQE